MIFSGTTLVVAGVVAFLVYYLLFSEREKGKVLPGPRGLPYLGNIFQIGRSAHLTFSKWAETYGDIFRVRTASTNFVVVSDPKMVKEMFSQEPAFTGRMNAPFLDVINDGTSHGIVNTEGDHWEQLRRFTLRHLRDFGFGKNAMETLIMEELNELLDWIQTQKGKPISDVKERFSLAVVNSLWRIMSGKRYNHDDPKLLSLTMGATKAISDIAEKGNLIFFWPKLALLFPELSGYRGFRIVFDNMGQFFAAEVAEHKETYSDDHSRDFIDAFLKEIQETKDPQSAFFENLGRKQLVGSVADLFFAGSDTTSTTLSWTMMYLTKYPEVQKKLHDEMSSVVGDSRQCSLSDKHLMPYTEAVIAEVLRYSSIAPIGNPHRAMSTREFRGYTIPKDTLLVPNVYHMHFNPKIWGDPDNFRPERFLTSDEKTFKKNEALMPFSVGKRQCLGESLARDTLFLFITNIFQKFTLTFDPNEGEVDMVPAPGFLLQPKPFKCIAKERN